MNRKGPRDPLHWGTRRKQWTASRYARREFHRSGLYVADGELPGGNPVDEISGQSTIPGQIRSPSRELASKVTASQAHKPEFPFWPQERHHSTPVSPVRNTVERFFIGSIPDGLPARGLVEEASVPNHRLVARSSYGPRQQLRDVALQAIVGGYANGILHAPLLQCLVNLRLDRQHRRETPLPYRALVVAQSPAVTALPSLPHYTRCPAGRYVLIVDVSRHYIFAFTTLGNPVCEVPVRVG